MKFIYVNWDWRNEYGSNCHSYEHYFSSSESKAWKKMQWTVIEETYMIFIYLQSFIHHFKGLFGTNIMTNSQLACWLNW